MAPAATAGAALGGLSAPDDTLPLPPEPPPGGPPTATVPPITVTAQAPRAAARSNIPPGLPALAVANRQPAAQQDAPTQAPAQPAREQDGLDRLISQIEAGRTNSEQRRGDAVNMALIEAGLRIAGSQSPHLAAAISEGAVPAVQGYSQERRAIRQDERGDLRDMLSANMAQSQRRYYEGRVENDRTRNALIASEGAADRANRLAVAGIGASARGQRDPYDQALGNFESIFGVRYDPSNEEHRRNLFNIASRTPGAYETASDRNRNAQATNLRQQINDIGTSLRDLTLAAQERQTLMARRQMLQQQLDTIFGIGGPPAATGAPPAGATVHRLAP